MKERLVGSALGRAALSFRDRWALLRAALAHPEQAGTVANDLLAFRLVTTLCQPGKTFVDVGAHIGSVLSEVAHRVPAARLVAVEAMPDKAAQLRKRFPAVEVHACAVGETTGEVSFFVHEDRSGYSSLGKPAGDGAGAVREITVPLNPLDGLIAQDDVDVIKIDVEGAELGALRGSTRILETCRPTLMFESGPQADDGLGYTKEDLHRFLAERDYAVLVPNRVAHHDDGLTEDGFLESHRYPRRTTNYFAVARERRDEIRARARVILRLA